MAEKYVDNTFPFAGINRIRFKGFYLSRFLTISSPKVYVFKYKGIYREIKVYASLNSFFMPLTRFLYSAGPSAKLKPWHIHNASIKIVKYAPYNCPDTTL